MSDYRLALRGVVHFSLLEQSELVICQSVRRGDHKKRMVMAWHGMASRQGAKIVKPSAHCRTGRLALQARFSHFQIRLPRKDYRVGLGDEARLCVYIEYG